MWRNCLGMQLSGVSEAVREVAVSKCHKLAQTLNLNTLAGAGGDSGILLAESY